MQARTLPPARGWAWLGEGLRLFRKNPPQLTFLIFTWWLIVVIAGIVPVIGSLAATLCTPAFSVSLMNACRAIQTGVRSGPEMLFSGFKRNLPSLVRVGAAYLLGSAAVLLLTMAVDGGTLAKLTMGGEKLDEEVLRSNTLPVAALVAIALSIPVMMASWFAPVLAGWHDLPASKALFFSFVACARNWRAFVAYGFAVLLAALGFPAIVLGMAVQIAPDAFNIVRVAVVIALAFIFVPALFASFYVSYLDIFAAAEGAAAEATPSANSEPSE